LPIALIAGGLVLVAAAVILIVLFTGANPLIGPWHSEALNQLLRFHDDETVVIHTQSGVHEGSYLFDAKSGKGVITKDGQSLAFTLSGETLLLSDGGTESEFVRGDMEIVAAFADATPSATPSEAPSEAPSATPPASPELSTAPSPTSAATPKPPASSTPKPTATPTTSGVVISQIPVQPSSSPSIVITISVVGTWSRADNSGEQLEFREDGTVRHTVPPSNIFGGEYEYDNTAREGKLYIAEREIKFKVNSSKKLTLEDGTVFERD
jgi:hypothetical protein